MCRLCKHPAFTVRAFARPPTVMNLLLHISRQYPQKGRGTVFLVTNFAFVVAVLKVQPLLHW